MNFSCIWGKRLGFLVFFCFEFFWFVWGCFGFGFWIFFFWFGVFFNFFTCIFAFDEVLGAKEKDCLQISSTPPAFRKPVLQLKNIGASSYHWDPRQSQTNFHTSNTVYDVITLLFLILLLFYCSILLFHGFIISIFYYFIIQF